jgi:hypothetical protein
VERSSSAKNACVTRTTPNTFVVNTCALYTAPAGSKDADALALLGAIGLQSFSS